MKPRSLSALLLALLLGASLSVHAQTNAAATPPPAADDGARAQATLDKHAKPILKALNLNDPAKETAIKAALAEFLGELNTWHAQNDAQIKPLWAEFYKAHTALDVTNVEIAEQKIAAVYASFKPDHDKFIAALSKVLTPAQVETVEDVITLNTVKRTYDNYVIIFHGATQEQLDVILKNLKQGREEAIDAVNSKEKAAFFKKYKSKIEAYMIAQGYDYKKLYHDFVAGLNSKSAKANAAADMDK